MTVKSAMNNCSSQNHGALWSPCCGAWNSAGSSYDDDSERPRVSEWQSGTADLTSRQCRRPQYSSSDGRRQPANGCRHCSVDVDVVPADQVLRHQCLPVRSPSEIAARRTLPRPAEACTTRQPAVVSHTVHSREIDKPLPQLAVAPPPTSSVPRSAPLRRRHVPDVLGNSSSSSKATQTTAATSRYWQRQPTFHELLASRGIVDDRDDNDDDEAAFLPRLSRPCSAPRMSGSVASNRACQSPTSSSSSTEAALLVNELAERGPHADLERFTDATDAASVFELLSRFQSATFPSLNHVDVEVGDDEVHQQLYDSDVAIMPGTSNYRSSDNDDVCDVFGDTRPPSDGIVRWSVADSVPDQVCRNLDDGEEVLEDEDNGVFSGDDGASVSSMSSAVEYPPSKDTETRVGGSLQAGSSGCRMTSTPMTGIPACLLDEDFSQQSEIPRQRSSSSPCDDDDDEDVGANRVRECNPETTASAVSNCDDAVAHSDAPDSCARDGQQRRRVVMYYPPQAFKFYIEQHMENVMKAYEERRRHRAQLEQEMEQLALPDDARTQMRRMLFQKESYHNRLRRTRMDRSAFRPISVLGRGAFADVMLVRKRDSGALYAMKRLRKSDVLRNRQAAHVKAERDILAEADNEWIVRLFYSFQVQASSTCYLILCLSCTPVQILSCCT